MKLAHPGSVTAFEKQFCLYFNILLQIVWKTAVQEQKRMALIFYFGG